MIASDKEGSLERMPSGRWAVVRKGREPVEITSGELFRVWDLDRWVVTRMEHSPTLGGYYAVSGHELYPGRRARFGAEG